MQNYTVYLHDRTVNETKKIGMLSKDKYGLLFDNDGGTIPGHLVTAIKFGLLTATSPMIAVARLVRSFVFLCQGEFFFAVREGIGAMITPGMTTAMFGGTLLSGVISTFSLGYLSFYQSMRRTFAFYEAWINGVDLTSKDLVRYSERVSRPFYIFGQTWTTAPCMHPLNDMDHIYDVSRAKHIVLPLHRSRMDEKSVKVHLSERRIVIHAESPTNIEQIFCGGYCKQSRSVDECFGFTTTSRSDTCGPLTCGHCVTRYYEEKLCSCSFISLCGVTNCCMLNCFDIEASGLLCSLANCGCISL